MIPGKSSSLDDHLTATGSSMTGSDATGGVTEAEFGPELDTEILIGAEILAFGVLPDPVPVPLHPTPSVLVELVEERFEGN